MTQNLIRHVWERASWRCEYCHMLAVAYAGSFHVDHIVARQHGGETIVENLALAREFGTCLPALQPAQGSQYRWKESRNWHDRAVVSSTARPLGRPFSMARSRPGRPNRYWQGDHSGSRDQRSRLSCNSYCAEGRGNQRVELKFCCFAYSAAVCLRRSQSASLQRLTDWRCTTKLQNALPPTTRRSCCAWPICNRIQGVAVLSNWHRTNPPVPASR